MNGFPPDRRTTDTALGDTARILAIMYTLGFFGMVGILMLKGIPADNKDVVNTLVGILSVIQTGIIGYYFGGSKTAEVAQKAGVEGRAKADEALQSIAKSVPDVLPLVVPKVDPGTPSSILNGKGPNT